MIKGNHSNGDTSQNSKVCRVGLAMFLFFIFYLLGIFSFSRGQETNAQKLYGFFCCLIAKITALFKIAVKRYEVTAQK